MAGTITFSGLSSGLDTSSWINALVSVKQTTITSLQNRLTIQQNLLNVVSQITSYFTSFQGCLQKITDSKFGLPNLDIFAQNLVRSSNTNIVTATATTEAARQSYDVLVEKLATNTKATSGYKHRTEVKATLDTKLGDLGVSAGLISVNSNGFSIVENNTIRDLIKKFSDIGIVASFDESKAQLTVKTDIDSIDDTTTNLKNVFGLRNTDVEGLQSGSIVNVSRDTRLDDLGVTEGIVNIAGEEYNILSVTNVITGKKKFEVHSIAAGFILRTDITTLGQFLDYLKDECGATVAEVDDTTGAITIRGAEINSVAGGSNIKEALGLVDVAGTSLMKSNEITYTQKHIADYNTTLEELFALEEGDFYDIYDLDNSFQFDYENTLGDIRDTLRDELGVDFSIDENGIATIDTHGKEIGGSLLNLLRMTNDTLGTDITGDEHDATYYATPFTLLSELGVTNGMTFGVKDSDGNLIPHLFPPTDYSGYTIALFVAKVNNIAGKNIAHFDNETHRIVLEDGYLTGNIAAILGMSSITETLTSTAVASTTLKELGAAGDVTMKLNDGSEVSYANTTTLETIMNAIKAVPDADAKLKNGIMTISGVTVEGTIVDLLGLEATAEGTNIEGGGPVSVGGYTQNADENNTLADIGATNDNNVLKINGTEHTYGKNTQISTILNDIDTAGGTVDMVNGIVTVSGVTLEGNVTTLLNLAVTSENSHVEGDALTYISNTAVSSTAALDPKKDQTTATSTDGLTPSSTSTTTTSTGALISRDPMTVTTSTSPLFASNPLTTATSTGSLNPTIPTTVVSSTGTLTSSSPLTTGISGTLNPSGSLTTQTSTDAVSHDVAPGLINYNTTLSDLGITDTLTLQSANGNSWTFDPNMTFTQIASQINSVSGGNNTLTITNGVISLTNTDGAALSGTFLEELGILPTVSHTSIASNRYQATNPTTPADLQSLPGMVDNTDFFTPPADLQNLADVASIEYGDYDYYGELTGKTISSLPSVGDKIPTGDYSMEFGEFYTIGDSLEGDIPNDATSLSSLIYSSIGRIPTNLQKLDDSLTELSGDYEIRTADDLKTLKTLISNGVSIDSTSFYLTDDIDLIGVTDFDGLGGFSRSIFYGMGHVIKNFTSTNGKGLFGRVYEANIYNLGLEDVNITGTNSEVGALVSELNVGTISNCYVTGTIDVTGCASVGGLVGLMTYCSVGNCFSNVTVTNSDCATTSHTGGLIGSFGGGISNIDGCYSLAQVTATCSTGTTNKGAIFGQNTIGSITATNCYYNTTGIDTSKYNAYASPAFGKTRNELLDRTFLEGIGYTEAHGWGYSVANTNPIYNNSISGNYTISSASELVKLATIVNLGIDVSNAAFYLTNDIDMSSVPIFTPIGGDGSRIGGSDTTYFSGLFDGCGHTISNLNISDTTRVGFFGVARNATIKNLGLVDITVNTTGVIVGTLAGSITNSSIENCYTTGTLYKTGGVSRIGGLVGYSNNSTITQSYTDVVVTSEISYVVGGIVGFSYGSTFTNCFSLGQVCANGANIGGIVGISSGSGNTYNNCYYNSDNDTSCYTNTIGTAQRSSGLLERGFLEGLGFTNANGWNYVGKYSVKPTMKRSFEDSRFFATKYTISTAQDLKALATLVNNGIDINRATFYLKNDIDMSGVTDFLPIGSTVETAFNGTFNGCGHVIKNLTINGVADDNTVVGLFGYIDGATIENLGLTNVNFNANNENGRNDRCVGALVGKVNGVNSTIRNCYSTGTITANAVEVGGLIGYAQGTIESCYSSATVTNVITSGGRVNTAGLIGQLAGDGTTITNCFATGQVTSSRGFVDGVIGRKTTVVTITDCYYNSDNDTSGYRNSIGEATALSSLQNRSFLRELGFSESNGWGYTSSALPTFEVTAPASITGSYLLQSDSGGTLRITVNGKVSNLTYSSDNTVQDVIDDLQSLGIVATVSATGVFSATSEDKVFYLSGNIGNALKGASSTYENFDSGYISDPLEASNPYVTNSSRTLTTQHLMNADDTIESLGFPSGGTIRTILDGTTLFNFEFASDDTLQDVIDTLDTVGISMSIVDGQAIFQSEDHTFTMGGALGSYLVQGGTYNTTETGYTSDPLIYYTEENIDPSTKLVDVGIDTGYINIIKNGTMLPNNIEIDENTTFAKLFNALRPFGITGSIITEPSGKTSLEFTAPEGKVELVDGTSNFCDFVGLYSINPGDYDSVVQYWKDDATSGLITKNTLLSSLDRDGYTAEGTLYFKTGVGIEEQIDHIDITADETVGSFLEKLNEKGLHAVLEDGIVKIDNDFEHFEFSGGTSGVVYTLGLRVENVQTYSVGDEDISYETDVMDSVAKFVDGATTLSTVNITSGKTSFYIDGIKAEVNFDDTDTFSQLFGKIKTAIRTKTGIADADINVGLTENGTIFIDVGESHELIVGASNDTSNMATVVGIQYADSKTGRIEGSRPLYKVNANSLVTGNDLFKAGNVTTGDFTIGNLTITITNTTTLGDLINQINYNEDSFATAYWDTLSGTLVLESKLTGASLMNIQSGSSNFTQIMGLTKIDGGNEVLVTENQQLGQNALVRINGTQVTSQSNTITSDVSKIKGLTLNLKGLSNGEHVTIKVEQDKENIYNAVADIVDSYNELMANFEKEVDAEGPFSTNTTLKLLKNNLKRYITSSYSSSPMFKNLMAIGISTGKAQDSVTTDVTNLIIDKDKFMECLELHPDEIKNLLVGTEANQGVFLKVGGMVDKSLSGAGVLTLTQNNITKEIEKYNKKISIQTDALARYRERLEAKFSSMENIISGLQNSYSNFLVGR